MFHDEKCKLIERIRYLKITQNSLSLSGFPFLQRVVDDNNERRMVIIFVQLKTQRSPVTVNSIDIFGIKLTSLQILVRLFQLVYPHLICIL